MDYHIEIEVTLDDSSAWEGREAREPVNEFGQWQ